MLVYQIIIGVLVAFSLVLVYIINNLLKKVENYEDVVKDQVEYLQNISKTVSASRQHLKTLDEQGTFQSDDEVGEFFNQMKENENELNRYMLPDNYGKEEIQS